MDHVSYHLERDIAVLTVVHPPVNTLSLGVRRGLMMALERGFQDPVAKALVIIGGGTTFVAGADINDFGKPYEPPSLYAIMDFIMAGAKPVLAAIHGTALGGGLELALACQWRIAAPSALIGQPEVKLGLMPGGGGTQWWTRLAGPEVALDVCTSGDSINARRAHACGVIDRMAEGDLLAGAVDFAREIASGRVAGRRLAEASDKISKVDARLFSEYRTQHRERWRGLLAPWKIVDCIEAACTLPFADGYALERQAFQECEHGPQSRAMIHLFFAERAATKLPKAGPVPAAQPLLQVGLVGADLSSAAIAHGLALAGIVVTRPADDGSALDGCDIIIIAPPGTAEASTALLRHLDALAKPDAVLAMAGSTLELDLLAAMTGRPGKVIGLNLSAPGNRRSLLEISCHRHTDPATRATALQLARKLRAVALLTGQGARSIVQRLLQAIWDEAACLVAEGVTRSAIAQVVHAFGFPADLTAMLAGADDFLPQPGPPDLADHDILEHLLYALVNEGTLCLEQQQALRAGDIDVASVHGIGFPAHRGGPMYWAQQTGLQGVRDAMARRHAQRAGRAQPGASLDAANAAAGRDDQSLHG